MRSAPAANPSAAYAIVREGKRLFSDPLYETLFPASYLPPIAEGDRGEHFFPEPIPHVARRLCFFLRERAYALYMAIPHVSAAEVGNEAIDIRFEQLSTRIEQLLRYAGGEAMPQDKVPLTQAFASCCEGIQSELYGPLSVSATAVSPYALGSFCRAGLMCAVGLSLSQLLREGQREITASLSEGEGLYLLSLSAGASLQNPFVRELLLAIGANSGFGLDLSYEGVTFLLTPAPAGAALLREEPIGDLFSLHSGFFAFFSLEEI